MLRYTDRIKKELDGIEKIDLPPLLEEALICVEDRRFYTHSGIDLRGIARAFLTNLMNQKILEGASTITQQLIRQLCLSHKKSYSRKLVEVILALWLERKMSKQEILNKYLNSCYFSKETYGSLSAAQNIFGKDLQECSLAELTFLAALVGRPLCPTSPTASYMKTICRQHLILYNLLSTKKINDIEFSQAAQENILIFHRYKSEFPLEKISDYKRKYQRPRGFLRKLKRYAKSKWHLLRYLPEVHFIARKHNCPFILIQTIIEKESSFNPLALSKKKAKGLMQLTDDTFQFVNEKYNMEWPKESIFNPTINMTAGTLYIKDLMQRFAVKVDPQYVLHFALAAYNAGPTTINRALGKIEKKDWEHLQKELSSYTIAYVNAIVEKSYP